MRRAWVGGILGAVACAHGGCSATTGPDVCARAAGAEAEVNREQAGRQVTRTTRALAPLPTGNALLAFLSEDRDLPRTEVRGTLIDADGAAIDTCGSRTERTYSAFRADGPVEQAAVSPVYLAPAAPGGTGFLFWVVLEGDLDGAAPRGARLEGRFVDTAGCVVFERERVDPLVLATAPDEAIIGALGGVALDEGLFVVVWPQTPIAFAPEGGVFARVFREGAQGLPTFVPVVDPETGAAVDGSAPVRLTPRSGSALDAVALDGRRFAVLVQTLDDRGAQQVELGVFDDRLVPSVPFRVLDRWEGTTRSVQPALAWDGAHLLATWGRRDPAANGRERLVAALLTDAGVSVPTRHAPNGDPFFLVADPQRQQSDPTVAVLPGGRGFLVAWTASEEGDPDDTVRAVVLEPGGDVGFANPACDRDDFLLHGPLEGRQEHPALARLSDGAVVAAWTDGGLNGRDQSGTAVRARRFDLRALVPVR